MIRHLLHRIAHWFGWNCGQVETWHRADGALMVGFRCECGKLSGIHPSPRWIAKAGEK